MTTSTPSLVELDAAHEALTALLAWRAVDIQHGTFSGHGIDALLTLRDVADRITEATP